MHHVVGYTGNLGAVTDAEINAITDGIYAVQNNHIVFPRSQKLIAAYAVGTLLTRARLSSPTLKQTAIPHIQPIDVAANPTNNPPFMDLSANPLTLRENEELAVQVSTSAVGPSQASVVLLVQEQFQPVPAGDPYWIRVTGGTAAVANVWNATGLTFADQLPVGRYAVSGGVGYSATMRAFRLTFDQQFQRPGGLGQIAEGSRPPSDQLDGSWGMWGSFATNSLPRMEVLCGAADATQEFFLRVTKMSDRIS